MPQNGGNNKNQRNMIEMHLNCIKTIAFILYLGFMITMAFSIKEFQYFQKEYDPTEKNLDNQPLKEISLQDQCEQGYEAISYNIQPTVKGCYCQGNRRYQCSQQEIKTQGCIPIMGSNGISLSLWPILPKSKWYRGIQICVKYYNGLNLKHQIEKKILLAQDCNGDYKICGDENKFFCINKSEKDCPISDVIFTDKTIENTQNIPLVSNISNAFFLYQHNQTSSYITDIKLIDGQGVCLDQDQISLSENKIGYELDLIQASNCSRDESYQEFQKINSQIFFSVNNFSSKNYFSQTRPFDYLQQSSIKMYVQHTQIVTTQCRQEIHEMLINEDSMMIQFQVCLYLQLLLLIQPFFNYLYNQKLTYALSMVACFVVLGLGIYQLYAIYDHLSCLKQMFDICQFNNYKNDLYQATLLQLILLAIYFIYLIIICSKICLNKQLEILLLYEKQYNKLVQEAQNTMNPQKPQNDQKAEKEKNVDQLQNHDVSQIQKNELYKENNESCYSQTFRMMQSHQESK